MAKKQADWITRLEKEQPKLMEQERAILEYTELICEIMDLKSIDQIELAKRLSRSVNYVNQVLSGNKDVTVRALSDILVVLGCKIKFSHEEFK